MFGTLLEHVWDFGNDFGAILDDFGWIFAGFWNFLARFFKDFF